MNKKILLLFSLLVFASVAGFVSAEQVALPNPLCPNGPGSPGCVDSIQTLISRVTDYIFSIIGIIAVLMFVISGIFFVISAGDPGKVQKAKDIAIWAAVGAMIAIAGKGFIEVVKAVIGA